MTDLEALKEMLDRAGIDYSTEAGLTQAELDVVSEGNFILRVEADGWDEDGNNSGSRGPYTLFTFDAKERLLKMGVWE